MIRQVLMAGLLAACVASPALAKQSDSERFASTAAKDGMAEIALGKLALERSSNQQVKDLATMIIDDHTKANDTLKSIAQQENITLPTQPGEKMQKAQSKLSKLKGKEFDRAYAKDTVADHQEAIKIFTQYEKTAKDSQLKQFASQTVPVLQRHLEAAEQLQSSLGKK
jgi:putative membrane protein